MAKLCSECAQKKPDQSVRGTCGAPNYVKAGGLPQGHFPWTESPNFTLCDACADHFGRCAWCGGSLTGWNYSLLPTTKRFCQQDDKSSGGHVEGMYVGEQILVRLTVDLYSGVSWRVRSPRVAYSWPTSASSPKVDSTAISRCTSTSVSSTRKPLSSSSRKRLVLGCHSRMPQPGASRSK